MTLLAKSPSTAKLGRVEKYKVMEEQYLHNAIELMGKKELRKASEMLWGTVTQSLKALAASKGITIHTHSDFYPFVSQLAKEQKDENMREGFDLLNILHQNFYDEQIPEDRFPEYYAKTLEYVGKIDGLLKSKP